MLSQMMLNPSSIEHLLSYRWEAYARLKVLCKTGTVMLMLSGSR